MMRPHNCRRVQHLDVGTRKNLVMDKPGFRSPMTVLGLTCKQSTAALAHQVDGKNPCLQLEHVRRLIICISFYVEHKIIE